MSEYAAQLQEEKKANTKLSAALKEAEQQLESNCIKTDTEIKDLKKREQEWQRLKSTVLQVKERMKQNLDRQWQEEKPTLHREKKSLKQILQEKEKEWKVEKTALTVLQKSQSLHLTQVEMQEKKARA
ncbi:hypothetical protein KUCAC02_023083 [Chaenocephalus aceratus]|uniref:Uncharacterized protein n=1 Tax=Chaenocephalus aceratus TaxID=36190 RepID=A0ACB9XRF1_CHAAC|nr:hypothetical protein KUCAC02_023083 [Chaenocephalus aceratus]